MNGYAYFQRRNPQSIEALQHTSRNQGELRSIPTPSTMYKLFLISLPHLFSRNIPSPCAHILLCQQMLKKQMVLLLLIACHRTDEKMYWDPWGSFVKGQVQTE